MSKAKIAGTAKKSLRATIDSDGTSTKDFVDKSVKGSGLSEDDWYKQMNQGVQDYAKSTGDSALAGTAPIKDLGSYQSALDSWYARKGDAYNSLVDPMQNSINKGFRSDTGKDLLWDQDWDRRESADWQQKWKEWAPVSEDEKKKAGKKRPASWVDKDGQTMKEVTKVGPHKYDFDPSKQYGIARNGARVGTIYKVWNPNRPDLDAQYAMVYDGSPAKFDGSRAEVTPALADALGIGGTPNATTGPSQLQIEQLGMNDLPKLDNAAASGMQGLPKDSPTNEQIREQGQKLEDAKKKDKKKTKKTSDAGSGSGGGKFQVVVGEPTVGLGKDMLQVAFADPSCIHTGGGHVSDGSSSVFVGTKQRPLGRVTDPTSDGYNLVTGDDSILVG